MRHHSGLLPELPQYPEQGAGEVTADETPGQHIRATPGRVEVSCGPADEVGVPLYLAER